MKKQTTQSMMVNIATGVLVLALIGFGYITFVKTPDTQTSGVGTPDATTTLSDTATRALSTSLQVAQTVKDLSNLSQSVESSSVIFNLPAFRSLKDFSVSIASEQIGRDYPFTKTAWRLKFEELERAAEKKASQQTSFASMTPPAPIPSNPLPTPTSPFTTTTPSPVPSFNASPNSSEVGTQGS